MADGDPHAIRPPAGPPPLLKPEQIRHLAYQGWLEIELPDSLVDALGKLSKSAAGFFDEDHEKKIKLYTSSRGTECGFYHVPDEKEYITLRHRLHHSSELEELAQQVWCSASNILHRILCDLSRAGGYDIHAWDHLLENSLEPPSDDTDMDNAITLMRLFRYYPTAGIAEEHVDIGLLTLCVGSDKGLQVLDRSQQTPEWVDAEGPVILVGEMTRTLMRNQVRAGLHRVVGNPHGRCSTVFALRPYSKHATDLSAFGGQGFANTRELYQKIKSSRFNINATRSIREQQRNDPKHRESTKTDSKAATSGHG